MVMKASPFFSKDEHAIDARATLFARLKPVALVQIFRRFAKNSFFQMQRALRYCSSRGAR